MFTAYKFYSSLPVLNTALPASWSPFHSSSLLFFLHSSPLCSTTLLTIKNHFLRLFFIPIYACYLADDGDSRGRKNAHLQKHCESAGLVKKFTSTDDMLQESLRLLSVLMKWATHEKEGGRGSLDFMLSGRAASSKTALWNMPFQV